MDQHFNFPVMLTLIIMQKTSGFILLGFKPEEIHVVSLVNLRISNILLTLKMGILLYFSTGGGDAVFN